MNRLDVLAVAPEYDRYSGKLSLQLLSEYRDAFNYLWEKVGPKHMWRIEFRKYYRRRTTGPQSQNHWINGSIQTICRETGNSFTAVKERMKELALSRGYPFETLPDGSIQPKSETQITTVEASCLIDTIQQFCAEYGIPILETE
jgi:hypothetical protein